MTDSGKSRLLWVLPKYPLPANDGARHASTVLLRALTAQSVEVDLVILDSEFPDNAVEDLRQQLGVAQVLLVPRLSNRGSQMFRAARGLVRSLQEPNLPITLHPFLTPLVQDAFRAMVEGRVARLAALYVEGSYSELTPGWNAIVYDGLHGAAHLFEGKRCVLPDEYPAVIYRAHNVESDIWFSKIQTEKRHWMKRLFYWQATLMKEFELAFLRKVSGVCAVSETDVARFKELIPRVHGVSVPIGYSFPEELPPRSPVKDHFLFVGKLDWPPNREGLIWFFEQVWPELLARGKQFTISVVGHGNGDYLASYRNLPGVQVKGFVESLDSEYAEAQASIVPLFYGSGTRVKIVEAARYGCPVLSTSLGAAGLGLLSDMSYLEAESVGDWIVRFTNTSSERFSAIGSAAYEHLKKSCDPRQSANCLLQFLQENTAQENTVQENIVQENK